MLTRFQIMGIATAIAQYERQNFGDSCNLTGLCDIIRDQVTRAQYDHENPLDALKQAESHLTDAINMLDKANDRYKTTTGLGKKADALMGELQTLIRYMEQPEPEIGDDGHDTHDERNELI